MDLESDAVTVDLVERSMTIVIAKEQFSETTDLEYTLNLSEILDEDVSFGEYGLTLSGLLSYDGSGEVFSYYETEVSSTGETTTTETSAESVATDTSDSDGQEDEEDADDTEDEEDEFEEYEDFDLDEFLDGLDEPEEVPDVDDWEPPTPKFVIPNPTPLKINKYSIDELGVLDLHFNKPVAVPDFF
jgi:hypothetical protein